MFRISELLLNAKRIFSNCKPERKTSSIIQVTLVFFVGLAELGVAGAISLLGIALASPNTIQNISFVKKIIQEIPKQNHTFDSPMGILTFVLIIVVFGILIKNTLTTTMLYHEAKFSCEIGADLGDRIFSSYMRSPYAWHIKQNPADLITKLNYRMRVTTFVVNFSKLLSQLSIALILITGAMAAYPKASGIVVAVTGFFGTLIYIFSRKRVESHSKQLANIGVSLNKTSLSALQAIREILIYRKQTAFEHQHKKQLDEYVTEYPIPLVLQSIPPLVLEFSGAATLLLAFFYMQDQGVSLSQISGTLALLAGVAWRLLPCLNKAVAALLVLHSCNPFIDQFFFNFKRIPADYEANYLPLDFQQEIRMTNLSFRYDESKKDSLVNINLTISKGKMIGLVGQSGAGKSTIVAILSGLLTPTAGAMYVDGTPVDLSNFHGFTRLGYVPQSPYLLDATLAENVAFCRWGEEPNREKVLECCEMAAVDFIDQLPYGIETIVGERGMRLSGGQVQRLAIARALYNNPSIIIFDEATSALDGAAEAALQQTINSLREKMTLVVIAHRLSTVENCDEIYWLDQGHVVDSGPAGRVLDAYNQSLLARRNTEPQE